MDSPTPPPIPSGATTAPDAWQPAYDSPVLIDRHVAPGTEGLTLAQVREEIVKGGRFVIYSWVISVLIMSFRQNSGIYFLRSKQDGTGRAFLFSLISLLLGPWGIPWGLIWTPVCIFTNLGGGKDVTQPVLDALLGPEESADVIFTRRRHHAGWSMILLRTACISAPVALIAYAMMGEQKTRAIESDLRESPGYALFLKADRSVSGPLPYGNTPEARNVAQNLALGLKQYLDEGTKHVTPSQRASHDCGVWCEIRDDRCIVLVHVPQLQGYDAAGRTTLADAAWMGSLACLQGVPAVKPGSTLHVGVRGEGFYESVMTGPLSSNVESKPAARYQSTEGRRKLIGWFNQADGANAGH